MTPRAERFAHACVEQNSVGELSHPHAPADADATDCAEWGITPGEWSEAVEFARSALTAAKGGAR